MKGGGRASRTATVERKEEGGWGEERNLRRGPLLVVGARVLGCAGLGSIVIITHRNEKPSSVHAVIT